MNAAHPNRVHSRLPLVALAVLVLAVVGAPASTRADGPPLDAVAVPWSELDLTVHKLVASASIRISFDTVPTVQAQVQWIAGTGGDPVAPLGALTATLESSTRLLGRS